MKAIRCCKVLSKGNSISSSCFFAVILLCVSSTVIMWDICCHYSHYAIHCAVDGLLCAGHDISDGGLITCLLEMAFAGNCSIEADFSSSKPGLNTFKLIPSLYCIICAQFSSCAGFHCGSSSSLESDDCCVVTNARCSLKKTALGWHLYASRQSDKHQLLPSILQWNNLPTDLRQTCDTTVFSEDVWHWDLLL